jgi:CheY-like chemotaxis protein
MHGRSRTKPPGPLGARPFLLDSYRALSAISSREAIIRGMGAQPIDDHLVEILLIGEDSELVDMYRLKFQMDGYGVTDVVRLSEWPGHRPRAVPDLVVLDVQSGDPSALAKFERLQSHPVLNNVPRVILSTQSVHELRQRGFTLTATDNVLRARQVGAPSGTREAWAEPSFGVFLG